MKNILFIVALVLVLFGCQLGVHEEGVERMDQSREILIEQILELNPLLRHELDDLSREELETIVDELRDTRKQKREELLQEIDGEKQLDEEEMKHYHDPNPPEPPIYEKPRPVPDPPTEKE